MFARFSTQTFLALVLTSECRMNRRKADFKFVYKFLEDDLPS